MSEDLLPKGQVHAGVSLLIAEDSPTQALALQLRLERHGFQVLLAGDGRAALELARQRRPALVITDIVMPQMDGYQLCQAIKSDPELQDTPVIVVTSLAGWEDITRSLEVGADNFLRKPFDADTLVARIDYILLNRRLRNASKVRSGFEVMLRGQRLFVHSEREQILDLLISTYEEVLHMNQALQAQQREVARANQVLRGLYQVALGSAGAESADAVCAGALQGMGEIFGARSPWLLLRGSDGAPTARQCASRVPAACADRGDCPCRRLLDGADLDGPRLLACDCAAAQGPEGQGRLVATPLIVAGRVAAVLAMPSPGLPKADELEILGAMGQQLSGALERVDLHQRLQCRAQQLEAVNQELESYGFSISHDLRAPLRVINGFSEALLEQLGSAVDAESARLLDVIRSNCHKMDALINALLELSRISGAQLRELPVDMAALVGEVAEEVCGGGSAAPLRLQVGALPPAAGDPVLLRQVWANLLSNAVKYSAGRSEPRIEVEGWRESGRLVYAVRDNGAGFDMRHYGRLFGVFQRLHSAQEFGGHGIGLANVKRIVARHGGSVWAEGEVDRGARFLFSLPAPERT